MESLDDGGKARKRKLAAPGDGTSNDSGGDKGGTLTSADIATLLEKHTRQLDERVRVQSDRLEAKNAALEEECRSLQLQIHELNTDNARVREDYRARCDFMERSIQVLKKDVNWTYSAPDIPRSHWIEQGYDEEYADNMEQFLSDVKRDVEHIRNGTSSILCTCLGYNERDSSISHDDALLLHFQELADAIQVSGGGINSIDIYGFELRPSSLKILMPVMENKESNVNMYRLRFPAMRCYEIVCQSIRSNRRLEKVEWVGIEIESDEQADMLIESIIDNQSIKSVSLDSSFNQEGVNGCRALTSLMTSGRSFRFLDFDRNGFSDIDDVAAALAANPPLQILNMAGNKLNDRDAELIAQALKHNAHLQKLCLWNNNITPDGFGRIRMVIYDPLSLNSMDSCNHTCWVDRVEGNELFATPQQRRNRKLYELLSMRHAEGSNARHLNAELGEETYVNKLVPRVLERIGLCSVSREGGAPMPLSIYFELVRSWKMPEYLGTIDGD